MRALLLSLAAAVLLPAQAAPPVTIELRREAKASDPMVTLGQLARLESPDLTLLRRLVHLPIGRAPAAGETAVLERNVLAVALRGRLGLGQGDVEWQGASSTRVASATQVITGDSIARAAAATLHRFLADRSTRSEAALVSMPRDIDAVTGDVRLQPRAPAHAQLRSRMAVWVEVWVGDRFLRVVPVTFSVAAWGEGLAATGSLPAGAMLAAARTEVDLLASTGALLAHPDGMRVRRAVGSGDVLKQSDVQPLPAVVRGDWAALRSGTGAVRAEARVQVLQDGHVGDNVRVRSSTAQLLARVTAAGQLEVAR